MKKNLILEFFLESIYLKSVKPMLLKKPRKLKWSNKKIYWKHPFIWLDGLKILQKKKNL